MRASRLSQFLLAMTVSAVTGCGLQQDLAQRELPAITPTAAPAIDSTTLAGTAFHWTAVRGHPVVIDFWASWCGPCRSEQMDLNRLQARYTARGVIFLGVDMRDDDAAANAFRRDYHVPYGSVTDPDEQIAAAYEVIAPPTVLVVDARGEIVGRYLGTTVGVSDELDRLPPR